MVKNLYLKIRYPRYILDKIFEVTPPCFWPIAEGVFRSFMRLLYWGRRHYCCICNSHIRLFQPLICGNYSDLNALLCPVCRSSVRLRFAWLVIRDKTDLLDGRSRRMLHIAPERCLTLRFRKIPGLNYLSADLKSPFAMVQMDITQIQYPDHSFDVIFCSHVLEHIPDDRKALRELSRVLRPGGWAILMVPLRREKTLEDPSVTNPAERFRRFGYPDHVRVVGHDYIERIQEAGFTVTKYVVGKMYEPTQMEYLGLVPEWLFYCAKEKV